MAFSPIPCLFLFILLPSSLLTAPTEEDFIKFIESSAASLTDYQITDDQLVTLEVLKDHSIYRHTQTEKHGAPIFVRKGNDEGKAVVVLKEGEDFLPKCGPKKRTFVVLKLSSGSKNEYKLFYAYVKSTEPLAIEWDAWFPRGRTQNKAMLFGFVTCSKSNMLPCKKDQQIEVDDSSDYEDFIGAGHDIPKTILPPLPYVRSAKLPHPSSADGFDYWCDISLQGELSKRFIGSVIAAMSQATTVLAGAEIMYKDEEHTVPIIQEELKKIGAIQAKMEASPLQANASTAVAEKLVNMGRSTVAGGTLIFYASIVKVGAFAVGELPPNELHPPPSDAKFDELVAGYKAIGMNIMRGIFRGTDNDEVDQPAGTPNPLKLMNENVVASLVAGRSVGQAIADNAQQGRVLQWLFGKADVGTSSSNGEQAVRQYKGIQKDGSTTGSIGIDNLNYAIDNAFGGTKKSSGQIFTENIVAGVYAPYGVIMDAGDSLAGSVLGIGKISNDRSYVDDLLDKALTVVGGAGGNIVDVVGDILGPIGLGGLWSGIAGVAAAGLGGAGAVAAAPGLGIYTLVKMGAKALGIGGVIGMGQDRGGNQNGNINNQRHGNGEKSATAPLTGQEIIYGTAAEQAAGVAPGTYSAGQQVQQMPAAGGPSAYGAYPPPPPAGDPSGAYGAAYPPAPPEAAYPPPPPVDATYAQLGRRKKRGTMNPIEEKYSDIGALTDIDIFSHVGWRTIDIKQTELATTKLAQGPPFVGFGNCVLKPVAESDWAGVKNGREAVLLYFRTFRTGCLKEQVDSLNKIVSGGLLVFNDADKTFDISETHAIVKSPKITPEQINKLGKAIELSAYSHAYASALKSKKIPKSGSRNAETFKSMALLYLEFVAKKTPLHSLKLIRNIAKLTRIMLTKSLEDFMRYKHCRKCASEPMQESVADCALFAALGEFITKRHADPEYAAIANKEEAFTKFSESFRPEIAKRLSLYFF